MTHELPLFITVIQPNHTTTMKTKLTKKEKEIQDAYEVLKRNGIGIVSVENKDFTDEWILDNWTACGVEPTKENIELANGRATLNLTTEYWSALESAIEWVAMKKSLNTK